MCSSTGFDLSYENWRPCCEVGDAGEMVVLACIVTTCGDNDDDDDDDGVGVNNDDDDDTAGLLGLLGESGMPL